MNIYVRQTKLTNVTGRVDYISSLERQKEKLVAVAGQTDMTFWSMLAKDCQAAYKEREGYKCVEGRELVVELPNKLLEFSEVERQQKLQSLVELMHEQTGTECVVALHDSHGAKEGKPGNCHVHIVFADRQLLLEPEVVVAERNLFFDETGKRRYKKSDIFQDGELKPGCKVVPKGTVLQERHFESKNPELTTKDWLFETKRELAKWINVELEPDKKRGVPDAEVNPFIPLFHVGKGLSEELEMKVKQDNKTIALYNSLIRNKVIGLDQAYQNKTLIMLSPDRAAEISNIFDHLVQEKKPEHQFKDRTAFIPRTKKPVSDKEKLRQLFRDAAEARKTAREMSGTFEGKMASARAKALSAEIDRKKRAMGIMQLSDYRRSVEQAKREAEFWRRQMNYWRAREYRYTNRIFSLDQKRDYLQDQLRREKSKFFPDRAKIRQLEDEIKETKTEIIKAREEYAEARAELWYKQWEAKREYKKSKKEMKENKKELRAQQRLEKRKDKELSR